MTNKIHVYEQLAAHLSAMSLGLPNTPDLVEILKVNLTEEEARVSLCIPNTCIPLKPTSINDMTPPANMSPETFSSILKDLTSRGMILSGTAEDGAEGYCLLRVGFAFPQTFFWKGEDTPHARKMAMMVGKYFNPNMSRKVHDRSETLSVYSGGQID